MDLRNMNITVGELMDHPPARKVLQKRFPIVAKHPPEGEARTVTLAQLLAFAAPYIPKIMISEALKELERV